MPIFFYALKIFLLVYIYRYCISTKHTHVPSSCKSDVRASLPDFTVNIFGGFSSLMVAEPFVRLSRIPFGLFNVFFPLDCIGDTFNRVIGVAGDYILGRQHVCKIVLQADEVHAGLPEPKGSRPWSSRQHVSRAHCCDPASPRHRASQRFCAGPSDVPLPSNLPASAAPPETAPKARLVQLKDLSGNGVPERPLPTPPMQSIPRLPPPPASRPPQPKKGTPTNGADAAKCSNGECNKRLSRKQQ